MPFTFITENITKQIAHAYLAKSVGNRRLSNDHVLSMAVDIEEGRWDATASEIVFDEEGALIDGHHRLHAVVVADPKDGVRMLVKRGVSKSARGVIDTGRTRSIVDLHTMFRPGAAYVTRRRAALQMCVQLIRGGRPAPIRTLAQFDSWLRHFKPGIDAVMSPELRLATAPGALSMGPVLGGLSFAHKLNPGKVMSFGEQLVTGENLTRGMPAHSLRALLLSGRPQSSSNERVRLARKVLNALLAHVKGQTLSNIQDGEKGLAHFRTAYDGKAMGDLVRAWGEEPATPVEGGEV